MPLPTSSAFVQEHVVGGIGGAAQGTGSLTRAAKHAARGIDALHEIGVGERAGAAATDYLELEPGNVTAGRARRVATALPCTLLPSTCSQIGPV
jgi:hypothetical protein